ncbi:MAG: DUF484 family protein [Piscirickettsiaceae bacterium]|nr:DUF484 family protein [Piscirickettsiaceae bacterium]
MGNDKRTITVKDITAYLKENPDFFIQQPDVIESLVLSEAPEGTISLAQKQVERLHNKNAQLHEQLSTLIDNARQNSDLQSRVHQLCLRLMDAKNLEELLPSLVTEFKQEFNADEVALRLFYTGDEPEFPDTSENIAQLHADDESLKAFDHLLSKQQPVCGRLSKAQKEVLFKEQAGKVKSVACLPIGHNPCAGLLAIASFDANRFHAGMATDYLQFLGEVIMRLLRPYHDHVQ